MQQEIEKLFFDAYEAHADAIFRHCYFRVSDRELAKDLTQETYTRTWQEIRNGKVPEHIRPFLYRVATNLIIDYYRKKKTYSLESLQESYKFDPSVDKTDEIIDSIDAKRALEFLPQLPESYRSVFVMRYIDDLSPKEIADITGETENTISVHIHRAAKKLRSCIENSI